jgi:hypothetical protein
MTRRKRGKTKNEKQQTHKKQKATEDNTMPTLTFSYSANS